MNRLELDFAPTRRWCALWRAALLCGAFWVCAASVWAYADYRTQAEALELAEAEHSPGRETAAHALQAADELAPQLRRAGAAQASLATAWESLYGSLEKVANPDVALLRLSAADTTLSIESEARDTAAMQAYVDALGSVGSFTRVHLIAQQGPQLAGDAKVRFSLLASWTQGAARGSKGAR